MALHPWLLLLDLILMLFLVFGTRVWTGTLGLILGSQQWHQKMKRRRKVTNPRSFYLHMVGISCLEKLAGAKKDPFVLVWVDFGLALLKRKQDSDFVGLSKSL